MLADVFGEEKSLQSFYTASSGRPTRPRTGRQMETPREKKAGDGKMKGEETEATAKKLSAVRFRRER